MIFGRKNLNVKRVDILNFLSGLFELIKAFVPGE
jgi:hypothetical protein